MKKSRLETLIHLFCGCNNAIFGRTTTARYPLNNEDRHSNLKTKTTMRAGYLAGAIGRGLAAGLVGTAVMTVSSTIESKLRGRGASDAPAEAAEKVLGVEPGGEEEKERFSNLIHWAYGTGWGAVRGLIGAMGLREPAAGALHFASVWGTALVMLPGLGVAPPATKWGAEEVAIDAFHHAVYAAATGAAFELLERH